MVYVRFHVRLAILALIGILFFPPHVVAQDTGIENVYCFAYRLAYLDLPQRKQCYSDGVMSYQDLSHGCPSYKIIKINYCHAK
jgi:hypothetical protein